MTTAFVQELIKNKTILIVVVALISLLAGISLSTPSNHVIDRDIKYQLNSENYMVLHSTDNTFDIYQSSSKNSHLTGTYQEYSDRYILTFSGLPVTQVSYKTENGVQALKSDGTLGKVWSKA